jgi:hypothetical protein
MPSARGVCYRPARRETRGNVAAGNGVDRAVDCCQHEEPIGHRLALWRKNAGSVQHEIGGDGENKRCEESCEHGGK